MMRASMRSFALCAFGLLACTSSPQPSAPSPIPTVAIPAATASTRATDTPAADVATVRVSDDLIAISAGERESAQFGMLDLLHVDGPTDAGAPSPPLDVTG